MLEQVRHEVKGQLAKLLATEDLVVENKQVSTAQFNVHTRVLTLPLWDRASNSVYDMLVAHEVGHALFTPDIDWLKDHKVNPSIVNIVEDVRIQKVMKRKLESYQLILSTAQYFNVYKKITLLMLILLPLLHREALFLIWMAM